MSERLKMETSVYYPPFKFNNLKNQALKTNHEKLVMKKLTIEK